LSKWALGGGLCSGKLIAYCVRLVREQLGVTAKRFGVLVRVVVLGSARAGAVARIASTSWVDAGVLLDRPFALLARDAP
jgi:hypothetical protein